MWDNLSPKNRIPNIIFLNVRAFQDFKQRRRRRQREQQNTLGLDRQNNKFGRASLNFVHFFAIAARPQRGNA